MNLFRPWSYRIFQKTFPVKLEAATETNLMIKQVGYIIITFIFEILPNNLPSNISYHSFQYVEK